MRINIIHTHLSQDITELGITAFAAFLFARFFNSSPLLYTFVACGLAVFVPLFLRKPEYVVFFFAIMIPFRDMHLISVIHLKRLLIWGCLGYLLFRQAARAQIPFSRSLSQFTSRSVFFIAAVSISLLNALIKLDTTAYMTSESFKTMFFSSTLNVIENILIVYICYYAITSVKQIQRIIHILFAVSAIVAFLAIFQYFMGGPPPLVGFLFNPDYVFYGRATSVFNSPNNLGHFLAPLIGMLFISFFTSSFSVKKRVLYFVPIMLLDVFALFLTFSRGAMLTLFFSFIVIAYLYYVKICEKRLSLKVICVFLLIILLAFVALQYYSVYLRLRLAAYKDQDYQKILYWMQTSSDFGRKYAAIKAIETFVKHPLLGIGFDIFLGKEIGRGYAVDNQYLKILVDTGLLGFIPFIMMLWTVLRTGSLAWSPRNKHAFTPEKTLLMFLLLTGFCTVLFSYMFADTLHIRSISGNLWLFAGAILAVDRLTPISEREREE